MRHICWHVCSSIHDIKIYNNWQTHYRIHFMHIHALVAVSLPKFMVWSALGTSIYYYAFNLFSPIMLCCSALQICLLCSRTRIEVRVYCVIIYVQVLRNNQLHVADIFRKNVLLGCICNVIYVDFSLEYIDCLLNFP